MDWHGKTIGFGITGSHCTYEAIVPALESLVEKGARVIPVATYTVMNTDTRFGTARYWQERIEAITGEKFRTTIPEVEPFGPQKTLDIMVIAPMTGNSLAKFANAMNDSPVLMAAKATMRNDSPVLLGISTNDALGLNAVNLGRLLVAKNVYFIPFGQDDPYKKPNSLVARMELMLPAMEHALRGEQLQPILVSYGQSINN
ncbi:MAG: dipicolinate synthase subunit B [Candidatus Carbobacillus altaicus]|uniref:Dipicolinate synthase subunit B n=1 Tax=Candidatus Carbonibacillus altaicus TaxID=2163959 RepID=A0A2R6Y194_9BACL|nr:dipicolinate synthase subunit B [Candidatus Carbobacillus altaicus]PTQ56456.1 MAG: Dipicolinate synthase subunit B [Candidatus Carbobacillus altaicus]